MDTDKMLKKMLGGKGKSKAGSMPKMGMGMPKTPKTGMGMSKMPSMSMGMSKTPKMSMGLTSAKGASTNMQNTWKAMTPNQKSHVRKLYKDTDKDRVPDKFDCQPKNIMRQDWDYENKNEHEKIILVKQKDIDPRRRIHKELAYDDKRFINSKFSEKNKYRPLNELYGLIKKSGTKVEIPTATKSKNKYSISEGRHRTMAVMDYGFGENIPLRIRKGAEDKDGDGIINLLDCNPNNKNEQDFSLESGVPIADHPEAYGYKRETIQMSPDDYMKKAYQSHGSQMGTGVTLDKYEETSVTGHRIPRAWPKSSKSSIEDYDNYTKDKEQNVMDSIKAGLHLKKGIVPTPYLETKKGELVAQEGRHRAVAAREMGFKKIPVHIVETDKEYIFEKDMGKVIDYYEKHPRGPNQGNCHNAVKDIANVFLNHHKSTPYSMIVYLIKTIGNDGKVSNHVVLKVADNYFDPTGIQYSNLHKGNHKSVSNVLPNYYEVVGEANVKTYL